jgi:hypothetical protein
MGSNFYLGTDYVFLYRLFVFVLELPNGEFVVLLTII